MKLQIPNPKLQKNSKSQAPREAFGLVFGDWSFSGVWRLVFGAWWVLSCLVGAAEPSTFALRETAQVDGEGVFLSQLVEADGILPSVRICDAPAFGKSRVFSREQVAALTRAAGVELVGTNWFGVEAVKISRRARTLAEVEVVVLLKGTLQEVYVKEKGELELRFTRGWTPVVVPDEPLTLKVIDLPGSGVTPSFITRFELRTAHEVVGTWQASIQARVWREIWVARSALKRGEPLDEADIARERRDMLTIRDTVADFADGDCSFEMAEPLQTGSPLLARSLKGRPVIHRGQTTAAIVQDGGMVITMKVEALEDGAPGQVIRARNPVSKRDVRGKVMDQKTILVTL